VSYKAKGISRILAEVACIMLMERSLQKWRTSITNMFWNIFH
jgi:hypothetical protein